jgi:hypothetical protein
MKGHKPVQTNDLVLSQRSMKQERDLGLNICAREVSTGRLEALGHFDGLLGNQCPRHLLGAHTLALLSGRRGVNLRFFSSFSSKLDLPTLGGCLPLLLSIGAILIHALLYEALGVQLFGDFHTQLQVLAHERF